MSLAVNIHVGKFSVHLYCKHVRKEETAILFLPLYSEGLYTVGYHSSCQGIKTELEMACYYRPVTATTFDFFFFLIPFFTWENRSINRKFMFIV